MCPCSCTYEMMLKYISRMVTRLLASKYFTVKHTKLSWITASFSDNYHAILTWIHLGLYFIIHGHARCGWSETETSYNGDRTTYTTVYYEGLNVYLNIKTYLFGHKGANSIIIEAGIHRYNFECQLPAQLPGSFEAKHGHVRYHIEACLDIPWRFDEETTLQFTVVQNDDLNRFSDLKLPCQNEIVKTFCCLFCESEPLFITVTIPCSGFAPG